MTNALKIIALSPLVLAATAGMSLALCNGERGLRSHNSSQPAKLSFVNRATNGEDYMRVYWLDYDGTRQHYADVFAGETLVQDTYVSHPWVVVLPLPGGGEICHAVFDTQPGHHAVYLD